MSVLEVSGRKEGPAERVGGRAISRPWDSSETALGRAQQVSYSADGMGKAPMPT